MIEPIAIHEAGHAVMCIENKLKFKHVAIVENLEKASLGHIKLAALKFSPFMSVLKSRLYSEKYISVALAGPVAEGIFCENYDSANASQDFQQSFFIALRLFGEDVEVAEKFVEFMLAYTRSCFVNKNEEETEYTDLWNNVKRLAEELTNKKVLTYKQVITVLNDDLEPI